MKLLIDNNISFRVSMRLNQFFEGSKHVSDYSMDSNTEDATIWKFAKENEFTILTKDYDFEAMSRLFGCPPKVIQLICGNKSTPEIISIVEKSIKDIQLLEEENENCLLYLQ